MTRPHTQRLARGLVAGLPESELDAGPDAELEWIAIDALMRELVLGFRRSLLPGWTIQGSARSDIHLRVPQSQSESDFQIRPGFDHRWRRLRPRTPATGHAVDARALSSRSH